MIQSSRVTVVLDTNVILHDSACLEQFGDNDVVLPVSVLEELDRFKKGNTAIHYHAREFVRQLDEWSKSHPIAEGIPITPRGGLFRIALERPWHPDIAQNFPEKSIDHRILNTTRHLAQDLGHHAVTLVSKDVNLRLKAKALGLNTEDYTFDRITDIQSLYTGRRIREDVPLEITERMFNDPCTIPADEPGLDLQSSLIPNEYLILRNSKKSALGVYDRELEHIRRVDRRVVSRIEPRNAEQIFSIDALTNPRISLVTLAGKAGTGKTLLALSAALAQQDRYRSICVARPVVPLNNRDIGFLPGDIESKLDPYMQPLYDNLRYIQSRYPKSDRHGRRINDALNAGDLTLTALSYIRGRSLMDTYFIVDEAQNLTPHEIKTIITRAGEGTKIIFTGDIYQIDHPYLDMHTNGLSLLISRMQGQPTYAHITLEKGERSALAELATNLL